MNETAARRIVLVQAFDKLGGPLWTAEDAQWASRLASETAPAGASPQRLATERAHHALQRLEPRDRRIGRWLARAGWRWDWLLLGVGVGLVVGLLADLIGPGRHVDLLSPAVWLVVAWNLAIYVLVLLTAMRNNGISNGWFRRMLAAAWDRGASAAGPLAEATKQWATLTAPLTASRAAAVVHAAAAAVGLGMMAGMYLRGLVFDFSAGWQSTFLEAPMVHAMLTTLLAPAQAVTGIAVPGEAAIAALRLAPQGQPAQAASAAAWIHLYAATLWLFVVAPRLVLSALAFLRAATLALRVQVPLKGGAFGQLGRWHRAGAALVQVLPYAQAPGAQTALGLRELLASELGPDVQIKIGDVTAVGDEDAVAARAGSAGGVLRVALVDLAATPEDEHHGRLLAVLGQVKPAATVLLLVDEAAFRARFVSMTARIEERRTAWREFANRHGARLLLANLDRADEPEAAAALKLALQER